MKAATASTKIIQCSMERCLVRKYLIEVSPRQSRKPCYTLWDYLGSIRWPLEHASAYLRYSSCQVEKESTDGVKDRRGNNRDRYLCSEAERANKG